MALAGQGESEQGLMLAGAVDALWESLSVNFAITFWDELRARYLGSARERLGVEADAVWKRGRELAFDDAVALARG
jgi:hypothetical protein